MANNQKDTIYIDIDDEITAIIEKVRSSKERIVALVLPKRASVLQSIVNMKLLKKTAESAKKHVVLITSEAALLPLAGAVGLHVAPTLQSRPSVPAAPGGLTAPEPEIDESTDFDPDAAASMPVGKLAPAGAFAADEVETIELDDDEPADESGTAAAPAAAAGGFKKPKIRKDSKLRIPDFNKFRLGLVLGCLLLVLLLVGGYVAAAVLPAATVTISTDSSDIPTNASITLDPKATELDPADKTFPAKIETKEVNNSQQVLATGQKNNGTKATGSVTVTEACPKKPTAIDAGTGFSSGGLTFISTEDMQFSLDGWNSNGDPMCKGETKVVSQQPGEKYNLPAGSKFAVAGNSGASGQNADAFSGGTDNIVKVVSQADIDSAKQKISSQNGDTVKSDLESKLTDDGYMPVTASMHAGDPAVTPSAQVGDQADTVTVTSVTTYTMYGIHKDDLRNFIISNVKDKIDTSKQKILKDGVDTASFTVNSAASSGQLQADLSATTLAGPDIQTDALVPQIKGKKSGDVKSIISATPGVTDVNVKFSPFWVHSVPKKDSKITIVIQKSSAAHGNQP